MHCVPRTLVLGGEGKGGSLFWSWIWLVEAVNTGSTPRGADADQDLLFVTEVFLRRHVTSIVTYLYLASAPALPR